MSKILIIGCGRIGLPLAKLLLQKGHQVTGVRRNLSQDVYDYSSFTMIKADVTDANSLKTVGKGFDCVFYILPPITRNELGYQKTYQIGLENTISHLSHQPKQPFIFFISSSSVYHQNQGEWVDEKSETLPEKYNGRYLLLAEKIIHAHSVKNIVVRFAGIYGSTQSRIIDNLINGEKVQRNPAVYTNRIHLDDCVGVLNFLLRQQLAGANLDSVYLASDDNPEEKWQWLSWLSNQLKLPPLQEKASTSSNQNKRCSNQRLKSLGYTFKYPDYHTGYADLIQRCSNTLNNS